MKFLCTKVKSFWLVSSQNKEKVTSCGLKIKEPFIGIELNNDKPTDKELKIISKAVEELFGENKKAFPIRVIDL